MGVVVELQGRFCPQGLGGLEESHGMKGGSAWEPTWAPPSRVERPPEHKLLEFSWPFFWENAQFVGTHCSGA